MLYLTKMGKIKVHGIGEGTHVDLTGTHGFVEATMLVGVKKNEVGRAVVEFVTVQMMALLTGLAHAPKGSANQDVNEVVFSANSYDRISRMHVWSISSHCRCKMRLTNSALSVSDVAVRIGIVGLSANEFRRDEFDNGWFHNAFAFS